MENLICPKCQSAMSEGILLDLTGGAIAQGRWMPGKPEKSFFAGLKCRKKPKYLVVTYRCGSCGYLESYAPTQKE